MSTKTIFYRLVLALLMPATLLTAAETTAEDLGMVIGADGNIYATADAAKAEGTKAAAMICYVGSDNCESEPYNHGHALPESSL